MRTCRVDIYGVYVILALYAELFKDCRLVCLFAEDHPKPAFKMPDCRVAIERVCTVVQNRITGYCHYAE